jgi:hypothetical protein
MSRQVIGAVTSRRAVVVMPPERVTARGTIGYAGFKSGLSFPSRFGLHLCKNEWRNTFIYLGFIDVTDTKAPRVLRLKEARLEEDDGR